MWESASRMGITTKGQGTISKDARRGARIVPGTEIGLIGGSGGVDPVPNEPDGTSASKSSEEIRAHLERLKGCAADAGWTTESLMKLTRGDD
jgi:hypothetical protein